jgi:hypothetical protein
MNTTPRTIKATGARGGFASEGAVRQNGGSLPIYICSECGADVVWVESKRTGRKYLANISRAYNGGRFYIGANIHQDDPTDPRTKSYFAALEGDGAEAQAEGFVPATINGLTPAEWTEYQEIKAQKRGLVDAYDAATTDEERAEVQAKIDAMTASNPWASYLKSSETIVATFIRDRER